MKINSCASSKITAQVVRADGSIKKAYEFNNIFTSFGLQHWARATLGNRIAAGSGSRTETEGITSLANYVRSAQGSYSYSESNVIDESAGVMRSNHTLYVEFPSETNNQNYSEIGIHSGDQNQLQTYALIRDANGQPTSVSVLAGENLRVYYVVQFSVPLLVQYTKQVSGVPTQFSLVPVYTGQSVDSRLPDYRRAYTWKGGQDIPAAGVITSNYNDSLIGNASTTDNVYNLLIDSTKSNYAEGISLFRLGYTASAITMHVHVDPPVYKTDVESLRLSIECVLSNGSYHA